MKIALILFSLILVCSCEKVEKVVESPKVQADTEQVLIDVVHEVEDIIEAE